MAFNSRLSKLWPIAVVLPALLLYVLFVLLPAAGNVLFSFTNFSGNIHLPMKWVGFYNYVKAFTSDMNSVGAAFKVTLIFSVVVTVVQNVLAVLLAVLVNMKLKLRNVYRAIIFMPNILGVVVIGLVWTLIFDPYSGPVNFLLSQFGISSALLGDTGLALYLVIFVTMWSNVGYAFVLYLAGLQNIPEELYEAGRIDGATSWSALRYITLPLIRSSITINVLICIIGTLGMYDNILVLTNGGPANTTTTLSLYMFKNLAAGKSQGYVAALSIIQFLFVLIVVIISQYYLRRKEAEL